MYVCSVVLMAGCLKSPRRLYWCKLFDATPDPSSGPSSAREPRGVQHSKHEHAPLLQPTVILLPAQLTLVMGLGELCKHSNESSPTKDSQLLMNVFPSTSTHQMHLCAHVRVWHGLATGFSVPGTEPGRMIRHCACCHHRALKCE
jgi:hypothetical protein